MSLDIRTLDPDLVVLVVIDIQERLLKIMDEEITGRTTQNVSYLTRMFKRWEAPIILTEQYPKGLGPTHGPIKEHLSHLTPIEKLSFSCCEEIPFIQALKEAGRPNVVITGMETHICVLQTVLDLLAYEYSVFVALDAVQSSSKLRWRAGLDLMDRAGAVILPTETLIFQLLGRSGTDDFKFFSAMLKGNG